VFLKKIKSPISAFFISSKKDFALENCSFCWKEALSISIQTYPKIFCVKLLQSVGSPGKHPSHQNS
jgi:hypothetical protein